MSKRRRLQNVWRISAVGALGLIIAGGGVATAVTMTRQESGHASSPNHANVNGNMSRTYESRLSGKKRLEHAGVAARGSEGQTIMNRGESFTAIGGSPEQDSLLQAILGGLTQSQIIAVRVVSPPIGFEPRDQTWLSFRVAASTPAESARGYWQALLVAGLFRDLSAQRGLPPVLGKDVTVVAPNGDEHDEESAVIDQPTSHSIGAPRVADVVAALKSRAAARGFAIRDAKVTTLFGRAAFEIDVTAPDRAKFLEARLSNLHHLLGSLIAEGQPQTEGTYVEVRDESGRLITVSAYSVRTGEGVGYDATSAGGADAAFGASLSK
jgi:hypothetical protein